jgi:hypothetical protein
MADLTKAEIKSIIKQIKEDKELKQAFDTALGRDKDVERSDDLNIEKDRARILKETAQSMNQIAEFRKQESRELQLQTQIQLEALKNEQDREATEKKVLDQLIEQARAGKELLEDASLTLDISDEFKDVLNEIKNKYNKIVPAQEKVNNLSRETKSNIEDTVDAMGSLVGLTNKLKTSKIGKMTQMFKTLKGAEGAAAAKALSEQLSEMFSIQNIAMNVFDGIFNQSMKTLREYDDAVSQPCEDDWNCWISSTTFSMMLKEQEISLVFPWRMLDLLSPL